MAITDQLRMAIMRAGVSQNCLAKLVGCDQSTISKFLAGERGLSLRMVDSVCTVLDLVLVSRRELADCKCKKAKKQKTRQ